MEPYLIIRRNLQGATSLAWGWRELSRVRLQGSKWRDQVKERLGEGRRQ